jgi:hypothetical protein
MADGIVWIEQGIEDYRATGSVAALPMWLALKAEALHLADRTSEALEAIREAELQARRFELGSWYAERTGSAPCFSRRWVRTRYKSRLRSPQPSE